MYCSQKEGFRLSSLRNLVLFGDSYSSSQEENSSDSEEFEVEEDLPSLWPEHLISRLGDLRPVIHNFAFRGATVADDLSTQLLQYFQLVPPEAKGSSKSTSLDISETLFVFYIGINDCGCNTSDELEPIVEALFDAVHTLYVKSSARQFLFIDVPPIGRSPGALEIESSETMKDRVDTWNELLETAVHEFAASTTATIMLFSSHEVISAILDEPEQHGFAQDDAKEIGTIWEDELHLTSAVHDILAERLVPKLLPE